MKKCLKNRIFDTISEVSNKSGVEAYVIGGYVRDCILGRKQPKMDIDIVVLGSGIDIAKKVANCLNHKIKVNIFKNFGTAMFRYDGSDIEFVGARKESYNADSRKPSVENGSLEDDQLRRDFTINALAISLNKETYGEFSDPFNGMDDISEGIIKTPLAPDKTFSDDPLRMMRAIRFACQLNFRIDPLTFDSIKNNSDRINIVSIERIVVELNKILTSEKPSIGLQLLYDSGLLLKFFPELHNLKGVDVKDNNEHKDNFDHTIQVVDKVSNNSDNIFLRWAALLHDIAKPVTKRYSEDVGWTFHGHEFIGSKMVADIFRRLKLPMNENMRYVKKLVALHLRPISLSGKDVTDSAVRRLLYEAGGDIDDLMILCEADITSKNVKKVKLHLEKFGLVRKKLEDIEARDHIRNFKPPIDGMDIIKTFDIKPGVKVGIIKDAIKDAILDGIIPNEYNAAKELMLKKAEELGLTPIK